MDDLAARVRALEQENNQLKVALEYARRDLDSVRHTIVGLPDLVLSVATSGVLTYMNTAAEKRFGMPRQAAYGVPLRVLSAPGLRGTDLERLAQLAAREGRVTEEMSTPDSPPTVYEVRAIRTEDGVQLLVRDRSSERSDDANVSRYMSGSVIEKVGRDAIQLERVNRGPVTVLAMSLKPAATAPLTKLSPGTAKELLDDFLSVQVDLVQTAGGALDKITGDGVVAVFGAPVASLDHAAAALRTAFEMRDAQRRLAGAWERRQLPAITAAFGLATSDVMSGTFGTPRRRDFTVVGEAPVLAARIALGASADEILIATRTFDDVKSSLAANAQLITRTLKFRQGPSLDIAPGRTPAGTVLVVDA